MSYKFDFGEICDLDHPLPRIYDLKERTHHTYIFGRSGTGKSVLMEHMANCDMQHCSVIYIDPKGKSAKRLHHLHEYKENIIYVDDNNPLVINPLRREGLRDNIIIGEFSSVLDALVTQTTSNPVSTVLMRELLNNCISAFGEKDRDAVKIAEFLKYERVRKDYLRKGKFKNRGLREYWEDFDAYDGKSAWKRKHDQDRESAKRVGSRLLEVSRGLEDFLVGENELNIEEIIDSGKSLLVDISKFPPDAQIYLTNLIVHAVGSYCHYGDHDEEDQKMCVVYVDECQTVMSKLFCKVLEYGRSAGVGFVLTNHVQGQIEPNIIDEIFGIVNTFLVFNCGDKEATRVKDVFSLRKSDFLNLPFHKAWLRTGINNTLIDTFPPLLRHTPPLKIYREKPKHSFLKTGWMEFN